MEFHTNVIKIGEQESEREQPDAETTRIDKLIERSGMVRASADLPRPSPTRMQAPERKQHNGLRCKKCFELLVRDDEFV